MAFSWVLMSKMWGPTFSNLLGVTIWLFTFFLSFLNLPFGIWSREAARCISARPAGSMSGSANSRHQRRPWGWRRKKGQASPVLCACQQRHLWGCHLLWHRRTSLLPLYSSWWQLLPAVIVSIPQWPLLDLAALQHLSNEFPRWKLLAQFLAVLDGT